MKRVLREIETDVAAVIEGTDAAQEQPLAKVQKGASLLPTDITGVAQEELGR
jgi:hypothetical protein